MFLSFVFFILSLSSFAEETSEFEKRVESYRGSLKSSNQFQVSFLKLTFEWRSLADKTMDMISEVDLFNSKEQEEKIYDQKIQDHFRKLTVIGNLRGKYLESPYFSVRNFFLQRMNKEKLLDLKRELQLTPMRLVAYILVKVKYIKTQLSSGFDGIKNLVSDIVGILFILFIPFVVFIFLRRVKRFLSEKLSILKRNRFRSQLNYRKYQVVNLLESYCVNIGLYVTFRALRNKEGDFSFFFAVAEIYFLYRIIITVFYYFYGFMFERYVKQESKQEFEEKKQSSAKKIAKLFLAYSLVIHSLQYIGGVGLTFYILSFVIKLNIVLIVFWMASSWSNEIKVSLLSRANDPVAQKLGNGIEGFKKVLFSLPGLIYILIVKCVLILIKLLEQFDFFKQISAKVFKRRLISTDSFTEVEVISVPDEYEALFKDEINEASTVNPKNSVFPKIKEIISEWISNPVEENSLALYGHKGSGKNTIVNQVEKEFVETVKVLRFKPKKRIFSEVDLMKELCSLLEIEESESIVALINKDQEMVKTIVILEETHFMFLSVLDGFKAYKKLLEIVNTRFQNIFWLGVFNRNAWNFLNAIYGRDESFRFSLASSSWSEKDIQKLILNRHDQSSYKISFNKILSAIGSNFDSEGVEEAREQFFRLLWEQAQGNPKIAIYLWLSSLTFIRGNRVEVGLPQNDDIDSLSLFSDSALFVYAALVRHESLSVLEAVRVTSLSEGVVRHAIKLGIENEFLARGLKGQYSFVTRYQYRILNHLRKKNFIIGN